MSICSTVTTAACFIDLATFAELEGFLYGGPDAITWFVAAVQKANWMSFIPIQLRHIGTVDFGQRNVAASVNRSGDYVLDIWFRCQIPLITLKSDPQNQLKTDASIRWTRNLMHNLFEKISISFNELVVQEMDSHWLDFNYQFRLRGSKRIGYRNMIGDIEKMYKPVGINQPLGTGGYFSCPIPFWFDQDSGVSLPVAALPFNDIKVNYHIRRWEDLVVIYPGTAAVGGRSATINDVFVHGSTQKPQLIDPQTNAHYAVVHNDERVKMGDAPRDVLIHQVQCIQSSHFKDISSSCVFDIRMSHAIVLYCFAAQNVSIQSVNGGTCGAEWSNYTTEPGYKGLDPIAYSALIYENTVRVAQGSDYYSLTHPFYFSDAIPEETGYHMYGYSLRPWDPLKPAGSTNYSKLANVSIRHDMSPAAMASVGINTPGNVPLDSKGQLIQYPDVNGALVNFPQKYKHVFNAKNHNIARVANGSLGHPTL